MERKSSWTNVDRWKAKLNLSQYEGRGISPSSFSHQVSSNKENELNDKDTG